MKKRLFWVYITFLSIVLFVSPGIALGEGGTLPAAENQFSKFTAAGTLMKIVDSFLFSLGARLLAGVALLGAAWNLKEQRFSMAIICIFCSHHAWNHPALGSQYLFARCRWWVHL